MTQTHFPGLTRTPHPLSEMLGLTLLRDGTSTTRLLTDIPTPLSTFFSLPLLAEFRAFSDEGPVARFLRQVATGDVAPR